jgi:NADH-quinone oxidoreductase subunit N
MNANLSSVDFAALSPLLIVLTGVLLLLLMESFFETFAKKQAGFLTLLVLTLAIGAALYSPSSSNPLLTPWLRFDPIARQFTVLFLAIGWGCVLLAFAFFQRFQIAQSEYYALLLSCLFGLILVGTAADFLILFLGLETLSIALYVLCGYVKKWKFSSESAVKYFLIGSLAAAFLLYGIALIYGAVGTTRFDLLLEGYQSLSSKPNQMLFLSGIALVTVGLAFKAALVPFHVWAPDVYEGAPNPVTAFMAVATKAGAFAAFTLIFLIALPHFNDIWNQSMALLAFPTLIYANFVALKQVQLRRFFAYSGISHAGYLIIPLAVGTAEAIPALLFYLVVYALSTLGCFAVLALLDKDSQGVMLKDLKGLSRQSPLLTAVLALCLLTLSGLPPTIGFFAKFYVFKLGFQAGYYALVIVGLLMAVLSAFYYLRIIGVIYSEKSTEKTSIISSWPAMVLGGLAASSIVCFSFYPTLIVILLDFISHRVWD